VRREACEVTASEAGNKRAKPVLLLAGRTSHRTAAPSGGGGRGGPPLTAGLARGPDDEGASVARQGHLISELVAGGQSRGCKLERRDGCIGQVIHKRGALREGKGG
jgi:hypothetical protein